MSPDKPRFRRDLEATPTEADGQKFVDVRDPTTGGIFRFYEFEYRVALAFDGLPYDRVIPWLRLVAALDYQEDQLREFAAYLHGMGFLESSPTGIQLAPPEGTPPGDDGTGEEPASSNEWESEGQATTVDVPTAPVAWSPEELVDPVPSVALAPAPAQALEEAPTVPVRVELLLKEAGAEAAPALPESTEEREQPTPEAQAPSETPSPAPLLASGEFEAIPPEAAEESMALPEASAAQAETFSEPRLLAGARGLLEPAAGATEVAEEAPSPAEVLVEAGVVVEGEAPEQAAEEAAPSPADVVHEAVVTPGVELLLPPQMPPEDVGTLPRQAAQDGAVAWEQVPEAASPGAAETQDGYAPAASADLTPKGRAVEAPASAETLDGFAPVAEVAPAQTWPASSSAFTEIVLEGVTPPVEEASSEPGTASAEPAVALAPTAEEAVPGAAESLVAAPTRLVGLAPTQAAPAPPATEATQELAPVPAPAEPSEDLPAAVTPSEASRGSQQSPAWAPADGVERGSAQAPFELPSEPEHPRERKPEQPSVSEARHLDSLAFPVLPTPPPESVGHFPPRRFSSAAWPVQGTLPTPPPVTPPPTTLGPLRARQVAERKHQRRSLLLFGSLGVLAAVALLAILVPLFFPARSTPHAEVRTVTAVPGTLLRYFIGSGAITAMPGVVLKLPASGVVMRVAKADSAVAVGDVVAAVEAARPLLNQLTHLRERLAFYQQIAEAMHQVGNTAEEEKNTANVEVRKAKIAKTLRALAEVAVVASAAGHVEETFTREGEQVEAGGLALRMRSAGHRAIFELPRAQAAEARRLGFCQVGVEGYVLDCRQAPDEDDETHVSVDIASLPAALLGRPARLARARFDGAVALPASAVQSAGRRHQVLVVSPFGRLEARPVTVAEQNAAEAVVIQGLDSGENVVLEPTSDHRPGMQVTIRP